MMNFLPLYVALPIVTFLASLFFSRHQEKQLSALAIGMVFIHLLMVIYGIFIWASNGFVTQELAYLKLFEHEGFRFILHFYFDKITATFALVGALITLLVLIFSRFYMHRDEGFKRYFCGLLLFYIGYTFAVFAGNFETLFIGWEIFGFTSFLLIGYYRDRYLPVKNAVKVISTYRLGDVSLILMMWMAHHVFHTNITFSQLKTTDWLNSYQLAPTSGGLIFIAATLMLAAAVKSAQVPFSSWLPRAMEGPTTSSAIFYGALSSHLGIFLLLRSDPLWQQVQGVNIAIILLGVITSVVAALTARVQSTVKTQIAYGAITQMGLMLIEIGFGLHTLVLIHFAGHAFLRAYQLLVSPSMLGYMIHNQFFEYQPKQPVDIRKERWRNTLYILCLKEWNLDAFQFGYLWQPFKWLGCHLFWMQHVVAQLVLKLLILAGVLIELGILTLPLQVKMYLPELYALLSLMCILFAFAWRGSPITAWWMIVMSQVLIVLAVSLNVHVEAAHVWIYLTTTIAAAVLGMFCLHNTHALDGDIGLHRYHGYVQERPDLALIFLICAMGLVGFPFTPTFIAIDLMLTQIHDHQNMLMALTGLGFLFLEIAALRIYARVYLGQHKKNTHPIAYRSS